MKRIRNNYKEMAKERHVSSLGDLVVKAELPLTPEALKGKDPILSFYGCIATALGIDLTDIKVNRIAVSQATAEELNAAIIAQMRRQGVRAAKFELEYRTTHLLYSPRVVNDDCIKDGVAYLVERA